MDINASNLELEHSITISYVCKKNTRRIIKKFAYMIGYWLVLVVETLVNREAIRTARQLGVPKIIVENDSQVKVNHT